MGDGVRQLALLWRCCCGLCSQRPKAGPGARKPAALQSSKRTTRCTSIRTSIIQGLRISDLLAGARASDGLRDDAFQALGSVSPVFEPGGTRRTAIFLGQSIFTPKNLSIRPPDPHDRPYAGWLYVGTSLLQETAGGMLENAELDFGIVGPGSTWQAGAE
jgi:Outer membrane protein LpxR